MPPSGQRKRRQIQFRPLTATLSMMITESPGLIGASPRWFSGSFRRGASRTAAQLPHFQNRAEGPVLMTRQYRRPPSLGHPLSYFPHHRFIAQAHRAALFLYNKQRYCIPEPQKCKHPFFCLTQSYKSFFLFDTKYPYIIYYLLIYRSLFLAALHFSP